MGNRLHRPIIIPLDIPVNTRRWTNADLMLSYRSKRSTGIKPTLDQRSCFLDRRTDMCDNVSDDPLFTTFTLVYIYQNVTLARQNCITRKPPDFSLLNIIELYSLQETGWKLKSGIFSLNLFRLTVSAIRRLQTVRFWHIKSIPALEELKYLKWPKTPP